MPAATSAGALPHFDGLRYVVRNARWRRMAYQAPPPPTRSGGWVAICCGVGLLLAPFRPREFTRRPDAVMDVLVARVREAWVRTGVAPDVLRAAVKVLEGGSRDAAAQGHGTDADLERCERPRWHRWRRPGAPCQRWERQGRACAANVELPARVLPTSRAGAVGTNDSARRADRNPGQELVSSRA